MIGWGLLRAVTAFTRLGSILRHIDSQYSNITILFPKFHKCLKIITNDESINPLSSPYCTRNRCAACTNYVWMSCQHHSRQWTPAMEVATWQVVLENLRIRPHDGLQCKLFFVCFRSPKWSTNRLKGYNCNEVQDWVRWTRVECSWVRLCIRRFKHRPFKHYQRSFGQPRNEDYYEWFVFEQLGGSQGESCKKCVWSRGWDLFLIHVPYKESKVRLDLAYLCFTTHWLFVGSTSALLLETDALWGNHLVQLPESRIQGHTWQMDYNGMYWLG